MAYFDRIAEAYDAVIAHAEEAHEARTVTHTLDVLAEAAPLARGPILEVGCGTGLYTRALRGRGVEMTAVDLAHRMLRRAAGRGVRRLAAGDAVRLPFRASSFAAAVSFDCFQYIEEGERAAAEMARCVQPGGWVAVVVPNYRSMLRGVGRLLRYGGYGIEQPDRYVRHTAARLRRQLGAVLARVEVRMFRPAPSRAPAAVWSLCEGPGRRWVDSELWALSLLGVGRVR